MRLLSCPQRQLLRGLLMAWVAAWVVEVPANEVLPAAQALGTLFYSAAERSLITATRRGDSDTGQAPAATPSSVMHLSGVVKRQQGKSTAWLNGQALSEGQVLPPARQTRISATGVSVDGHPVRVGEVLDLISGERQDVVSPGAVSSKRPP